MSELELERRMDADADAVFAVVSDLDRLSEWLPAAVHVAPAGDGAAHAEVPRRDVAEDGRVRVRPEQLRLEWGSADTPDYAGSLQVMHADEGHSSVLVHLSFLGHQPETRDADAADEVRGWLDESLDRLSALVARS